MGKTWELKEGEGYILTSVNSWERIGQDIKINEIKSKLENAKYCYFRKRKPKCIEVEFDNLNKISLSSDSGFTNMGLKALKNLWKKLKLMN